jgi:signal recognition particle subunit SEC65
MIDVDQLTSTVDPFYVLNKSITRFKAKTLKEVFNELVVQVSVKAELENPLKHQEKVLIHLIHVQEELNPPVFGS